MINNHSTNGIYIKEENDDARKRRTYIIIDPIANNNNVGSKRIYVQIYNK
jgi:hypothetical protein